MDARTRERWRELGLVVTFRHLEDGEVCDACRQLARHVFKPGEAPSLPYELCTSERGCKCTAHPLDVDRLSQSEADAYDWPEPARLTPLQQEQQRAVYAWAETIASNDDPSQYSDLVLEQIGAVTHFLLYARKTPADLREADADAYLDYADLHLPNEDMRMRRRSVRSFVAWLQPAAEPKSLWQRLQARWRRA